MTYDTTYTSPLDTIYGNLALSTGTTIAPAGSYYTSTGFGTVNFSNPITTTSNGTLELIGDDADIKINGESLMSVLQEIQNHLRIPAAVVRDTKAEAEWAELQAAGERYESLLKQYKAKRQVWETLKKEY
jgi:hypothetical protein